MGSEDLLDIPWVLSLIHTDSLSLSQTHTCVTGSLTPAQIHSVSPRFHFHLVSLRLTQIHTVPFRPNQPHSDQRVSQICSVSLRFMQPRTVCSDPCSSTQIHSGSPNFTQSHADSLKITQIHSDPFTHVRIRSDSLTLAPDSLYLPQTDSD